MATAVKIEKQPGDQEPPYEPKLRLNDMETAYMRGPISPATSSVLISNSKYLNSPNYRDAFIQQSLRRFGPDLPTTYMVPAMVQALGETTDYAEVFRLFEQEKARLPEFAAWLSARRLSTFTAESVRQYATGTLGAEIHAFLSRPGFEMQFMAASAGRNDFEYMVTRRVGLHDIEHMVTGFGPNIMGEYGLASANIAMCANYFVPEFAQFMNAANVWITAAGMKQTSLHYPHVMPVYLEALQQGIAVGNAVKKPLFMVEWEDFLDWQLDDIANHLGFVRGPGAGWDWTEEACRG